MRNGREITSEVCDIPQIGKTGSPPRGKWLVVLADLMALPEGKALKLPPLSGADMLNLRQVVRYRGRGLHFRSTPEATFVWLGGEVTGQGISAQIVRQRSQAVGGEGPTAVTERAELLKVKAVS